MFCYIKIRFTYIIVKLSLFDEFQKSTYILLNWLIWCDLLCKLNRSLSLLEASLKSCFILRGWVLYSRFRRVHGTLKFLIGDGMNGVYKRLIQLVHY